MHNANIKLYIVTILDGQIMPIDVIIDKKLFFKNRNISLVLKNSFALEKTGGYAIYSANRL